MTQTAPRVLLSEYEAGYLAGLAAYLWWKDGVRYVGTTGTRFNDAAKEFLTGRGLSDADAEMIARSIG